MKIMIASWIIATLAFGAITISNQSQGSEKSVEFTKQEQTKALQEVCHGLVELEQWITVYDALDNADELIMFLLDEARDHRAEAIMTYNDAADSAWETNTDIGTIVPRRLNHEIRTQCM